QKHLPDKTFSMEATKLTAIFQSLKSNGSDPGYVIVFPAFGVHVSVALVL
ncbi:unnamed protein product, partial [Trichobilharzia szidati]